MKKTAIFFLCCLLLIFPLTAQASTGISCDREDLENGYYIETILEEVTTSVFATTSTKSGKKTATCKDSSGNAVWSITVHGSFTYNGTSAKCTAVSMSQSIKGSNWTLSDQSYSRSGASCKASATGKLKANGTVIQTISKTVTLKCSAKGVLS